MDDEKKLEIGRKIFNLMAEGKTCTEACKLINVSRTTFLGWMRKDGIDVDSVTADALRVGYRRAKEAMFDALVEEGLVRMRSPNESEVVEYDGDGDVIKRKVVDNVARDNLYFAALKWTAGKLYPTAYGDRVTVTGDESAPVRIEWNVIDPRKVLPE